MGWYYTHGASRAAIVREIVEPRDSNVSKRSVRRHCLRGNVLWTLEHLDFDDGSVRPMDWIGCYLLSRGSGDGWGYKPMDESFAPYYYTCPLSYLDAAPVLDAGWRDKVRTYHANAQAKRAARRPAALTEEQKDALARYMKLQGPGWKAALLNDWFYARLTGPLHMLRNTHGATWLMRYRPTRDVVGI